MHPLVTLVAALSVALAAAPSAIADFPNLFVQSEYRGPGEQLFPRLRDALVEAAPQAAKTISANFGTTFSGGFSQPVTIQVTYDPKISRVGQVQQSPDGQTVAMSLLEWERCPSKKIFGGALAHELSHAALRDGPIGKSGVTVPQWFDEGLAMLIGGEPALSEHLDTMHRRFGVRYMDEVSCPLDKGTAGLAPQLLRDCYAFYALAVMFIADSRPGALPGVMEELGSGHPLDEAIAYGAGMKWGDFTGGARAYATRKFASMPAWRTRITGWRRWRQKRWCDGRWLSWLPDAWLP